MIETIRRIACHPAVWPGFGGSGDPETWNPPIRAGIEWWIGGDVLLCFIKTRPQMWEVHIGALPEAQDVRDQGLKGLEWFREKHGSPFLVGFIKKEHTAALICARSIGMRVLLKHPDQYMVGMEL